MPINVKLQSVQHVTAFFDQMQRACATNPFYLIVFQWAKIQFAADNLAGIYTCQRGCGATGTKQGLLVEMCPKGGLSNVHKPIAFMAKWSKEELLKLTDEALDQLGAELAKVAVKRQATEMAGKTFMVFQAIKGNAQQAKALAEDARKLDNWIDEWMVRHHEIVPEVTLQPSEVVQAGKGL